MRTIGFAPLLLLAAGLLTASASLSCCAASDDPAVPSLRESNKMHHVHSELSYPGQRDYLVLSQNHCVDQRRAAKLPAAPRLTKETIDRGLWVVSMDEYISSDRMASYTRSHEDGRLSDDCVFINTVEKVGFESLFADGRRIRWSRSDGVYHQRVEEKQDLSVLKKMISESLGAGMSTGQSAAPPDSEDLQPATGRLLTIAGIPCAEYRIPAQNSLVCSAEVSDPVPMIDILGQNRLILSVSITGDVISTRNRRATKVLLSRPIDLGVFDPKSL